MRSSHLFVFTIQLLLLLVALSSGYPQNLQNAAPSSSSLLVDDQQAAAAEGERDEYVEALEQEESRNGEQFEGSESFYPSFAPLHNPPLGHSRPFYQQERAYSHRPTGYQQQQQLGFDSGARFSGYKSDTSSADSNSQGLLGSGNFGVIRGGTFFGDSDGDASGYEQYGSYYQNGHGRPSFYFPSNNPKPRQFQQFENFRDFADINVPSSYSHYVVVYANKNSTTQEEAIRRPKNIIEHLQLLDAAEQKKLSKSKRKLSLTSSTDKKRPRWNKPSPRDLREPLLALS
ncbi:PREDICTED: uncharacterized protein LOC108564698 [Nicrophorus vespilloides]|uniref:Uncharacterized protein LOC108564698 n=1 Tax=Nicrophorus vespilloides TaxID=110193 RepID=A0ABM1MXI6_NICVS|nr:PREDICTED: uncharacterized protein LOC108564698 [Nicrophorus vespilloides]